MVAPINIAGDTLSVRFSCFDIENYRLFLKVKALPEFTIQFHEEDETYTVSAPSRFARMLGVEVPRSTVTDLPLYGFLIDDQVDAVLTALEAKRFAYWARPGLGKTVVGLEFSRHVVHRTGGRALIFTLNDIVPQWLDEARKFYGDSLPVYQIHSREEMKAWAAGTLPEGHPGAACKIAVANYEKMNYRDDADQVVNELRYLACVIVDENRLKGGGGKQKWAIIKSCKGIEYKLSLTATPAPNDTIEFASQASFLEKMRSDGDIIWTYFQRNEKTHRWEVKRHARKDFFRFMAGWSRYVWDPRRYGWRKDFEEVPPPTIIRHSIEMTDEQRAALQKFTRDPSGQLSFIDRNDRNAIQRGKLSQVAKGFVYVRRGSDGRLKASRTETSRYRRIDSLKPAFVARLMVEEIDAGLKPLCWTVFDAESDLIAEELQKLGCTAFDSIHGKTKPARRREILEKYRHGESSGLLTKGSLLGWGMNFQFCRSMIFSGFDDSYEKWFQQICRAVRFGQEFSVRVHLPVCDELEGDMLENLFIKQAKHEAAIAEMEAQYIAAAREIGAIAA